MSTKNDLYNSLNTLKLSGMTEALEQQFIKKEFTKKSFIERLHHLLEAQVLWTENRRLVLNQKQANLRWPDAAASDIDFDIQKSLDKDEIWNLFEMSWLEVFENLFLNGPTGSGKTHLACAFGNAAMLLGYKVRFFKYSELIVTLCKAKRDDGLEALYRKFNKIRLFIIDELRPVELDEFEGGLLFDFIESRDMKSSFIFTSQYPLSDWYDGISDATLADAILDRVSHNAITIDMLEKVSLRKVFHGKRQLGGKDVQ